MQKFRTKHALMVSIFSLVLCVAMLAGTTFAWFTDEVSSTGNKIRTGTLKVDLVCLSENGEISLKATPDHKIFDYLNWEPGYTSVVSLRLENNGSLAFQYQLSLTTPADAEQMKLAEVIEVYMIDGQSTAASLDAVKSGWTRMGLLSEYLNNPENFLLDSHILAETDYTFSIALHMSEEAGNEYQNLDLGEIFIDLVAGQHTYESDAFDDQYDAEAPTVTVSYWDGVTKTLPEKDEDGVYRINSAAELAGLNELLKTVSAPKVSLNIDIDLGGYAWTPIGLSGTPFKGAFDGNGYTVSNLSASGDSGIGLFGWLFGTVTNLTIDGATVEGTHYVGSVAGYSYGKITACTVENAAVTCADTDTSDDGWFGIDANGDDAGAIAGYLGEGAGVIVANNTVRNATVNANRNAGRIVGYAQEAGQVYDNISENVIVTCIPGGGIWNGLNIRNDRDVGNIGGEWVWS